MGQYVLLLRGSQPREEDLKLIESAPGVRVLDQTFNRAMLLEGSEDAVSALSGRLKDWLIAEQVSYPQPGPAGPEVRDPEA
jgi:hypothetical protein